MKQTIEEKLKLIPEKLKDDRHQLWMLETYGGEY